MLDNLFLNRYIHYLLKKPVQEEMTPSDFQNIKRLVLNKFNIGDVTIVSSISVLEKFPHLESLSIEQLLIDDAMVEWLNQQKFLQALEMGHCKKYTTHQIATPINSLFLNNMTPDTIHMFTHDNGLQQLTLNKIEGVDMQEIIKFANIRDLKLFSCKVRNTLYINQLENLNRLTIEGTTFDNENSLGYLKDEVMVTQKTFHTIDNYEIE